MFEEDINLSRFRTTLKKVIINLESLHNIPIHRLKEDVIEAFENYSYDGVDEIKFDSTWDTLRSNGEYVLGVGVDHKNAYRFSVHLKVESNQATITNVL